MKPWAFVWWLDAQDHAQKWVDEQDAEEFGQSNCQIVSGGFVISKTDKYITLGADWDEADKDYGRVTKIPISMTTLIQEMKWPLESSSQLGISIGDTNVEQGTK